MAAAGPRARAARREGTRGAAGGAEQRNPPALPPADHPHPARRLGQLLRCGGREPQPELLFLPPAMVRYVLVHELCHSLHLNHSAEFWNEVARHEPRLGELKAAMRDAARYVPDWLLRPRQR